MSPHPEERRLRRVSKDAFPTSWFETREDALLSMRSAYEILRTPRRFRYFNEI
jgi:hypothetical protein